MLFYCIPSPSVRVKLTKCLCTFFSVLRKILIEHLRSKSKSKKTKQTSDKRNHLRSKSRKAHCRKRLCTVDLLKITTLDQHIFISKILFTFVTKQATLMRRSIVLILPFQLVFPGEAIT